MRSNCNLQCVCKSRYKTGFIFIYFFFFCEDISVNKPQLKSLAEHNKPHRSSGEDSPFCLRLPTPLPTIERKSIPTVRLEV